MKRSVMALIASAFFFIIFAGQPESADRFKVNKNCTLADSSAGLMWLKSPDAEAVFTWQGAADYVKGLDKCGHRDWRLPSKEELEGLAGQGGKNPSDWLGAQGFENIQWGFYWTSSVQGDKAWYVDLGTGESGLHPENNQYYVMPVRSVIKASR
jgi:hypothetical protein